MRGLHAIAGFYNGKPFYRVSVKVETYHRIALLAHEGVEGLPDWVDLGADTQIGRRIIATSDPEHFEGIDND